MFSLRNPKHRSHFTPVRVVVGSFILAIIIGTILLMLPMSSTYSGWTKWEDALFTASSAICVTGLSVVDISSYFTFFGQMVILLLIQVGGIGVVSFATFFAMTLKGRLGLRNLRLAGESANFGSITNIPQLLKTIVGVTFICEGIGALLLAFRIVPIVGWDGIFQSIFLSVSAYCSAGFEVFGAGMGENLSYFANDYYVLGIVSILITIGGIGFVVFQDVLTSYKGGKKVHRLMLHSKVVLSMTAAIIVIGTICILLSEWNFSMAHFNVGEKALNSFFSVVSARTAGFSAIDYAATNDITQMITSIIMFIGASPGSTGGGIKTTTALILIMTIYGVIRGQEETTIFKRQVKKNVVYRSLALAFLAGLIVFITSVIMYFIEPTISMKGTLFEVISAFSTTGLSIIGTPNLHDASKVLLSILMFIGRVGPITFIITLTIRGKRKGETLPEGRIMVG